MEKKIGLPRNPEKYFKYTPRINTVSDIVEISTSEHVRGIAFDSLNEIEDALLVYASKINNQLSERESQQRVRRSMHSIKRKMISVKKENVQSFYDKINGIKHEILSLEEVSQETKKDTLNALENMYFELSEVPYTSYNGKIFPSPFLDGEKEIISGIEISKANKKYIMEVNALFEGDPRESDAKRDSLEKKLAEHFGKEQLLQDINIEVTFREVEGAWYNVPFVDIAKSLELKFRKRNYSRDTTKSEFNEPENFNEDAYKILAENMIDLSSGPTPSLCLSYRDKVTCENKVVPLRMEFHYSRAMPHFDEKKKGEYPKKVDGYACVRGGSLIGSAWNYYRNGKAPQIQRPSLEISLSIPVSSTSVENDLLNADSNKVKLLLETKDFILNRLKPYCKK